MLGEGYYPGEGDRTRLLSSKTNQDGEWRGVCSSSTTTGQPGDDGVSGSDGGVYEKNRCKLCSQGTH